MTRSPKTSTQQNQYSQLIERPRRLRRTSALRGLTREVRLHAEQLIYPLFVHEATENTPIRSMPQVERYSLSGVVEQAHIARDAGLRSLMLFGIPDEKDAQGTQAYHEQGIVQRATRAIKKALPDMAVMADTCLCEYTSHGHCGHLVTSAQTNQATQTNQHTTWSVDNDPTLDLLAQTAVSQAMAGADVVAPSAMMDGQIWAIRQALDEAGFVDVPIMSYAVKYASAYYGPFREAAGSTPEKGDRATYQMDSTGGYREALREARLDVEQGADFLMVKPALAYLDVLQQLRQTFDLPLVAYNVSGEYALIKAAAQADFVDEKRMVLETLGGMVRAGADAIITYHAVDAARWLD